MCGPPFAISGPFASVVPASVRPLTMGGLSTRRSGCAPIAFPQRRRPTFFLTSQARFPRESQKSRTNRRPPLCFCPSGAGRSSPVASTAIEAAITRARLQKDKDHGDHWHIREKQGWIHRAHYDRIFQHAGQTGPGSAGERKVSRFSRPDEHFRIWRRVAKTSQNGRDYLSVRLDDPSFATPIFANLVEGDNANDHILIWSRSQR